MPSISTSQRSLACGAGWGRGLYLYLPSRAYPPRRYSLDRPRTFELADILGQIGGRIPGTRSQRLQMFERPSRNFSITKELDGARLWCGKFRFQIEERPAPYDHRIRCWIETDPGVTIAKQELLPLHSAGDSELPSYERGGALLATWKAAGGTEDTSASLNKTTRVLPVWRAILPASSHWKPVRLRFPEQARDAPDPRRCPPGPHLPHPLNSQCPAHTFGFGRIRQRLRGQPLLLRSHRRSHFAPLNSFCFCASNSASEIRPFFRRSSSFMISV